MPQTDLILLRAPSLYDSRKLPLLHIPRSGTATSLALETSANFLSLANRLEQAGLHARIIDLPHRTAPSKRFDASAFVKTLDASLFAIEVDEVMQAPGALETVELVKKHHPESRIILWGCAATRFHTELIIRPKVDFVIRGRFEGTSAVQFEQAITDGKFERVPNLDWKDKLGQSHQNELSAAPPSTNLNVTEYYRCVIRQIWLYHNFDGAWLLNDRLRHPVISIFKSGCMDCPLFPCREISEELETTASPNFRAPEDVYHDTVEICRFSPAPILIKGDIRIPSDHFGERLLSLLQHKPVASTLIFELGSPASAFFIQEIARAATRFRLNIAPGSQDETIRKTIGRTYSNKELEATIEAALRARAGGVEVMFLVGLPGQTAESVTDTMAYCEYLLRRFDGDRRLSLSIAPLLNPRGSHAWRKTREIRLQAAL